jgi:hypothetical protein
LPNWRKKPQGRVTPRSSTGNQRPGKNCKAWSRTTTRSYQVWRGTGTGRHVPARMV